jgi:hypothetical protein
MFFNYYEFTLLLMKICDYVFIPQVVDISNVFLKWLHTYHSRFIPEGVAEASQIFLRDTHGLPKLFSYEEYCRREGGKPIAVWSQIISGVNAVNP